MITVDCQINDLELQKEDYCKRTREKGITYSVLGILYEKEKHIHILEIISKSKK